MAELISQINLETFYKLPKWIKMSSIGLISVICGVTLRSLFDKISRKMYNYPPGTCGMPFLGSIFNYQNKKFYFHLLNAYGSVSMVYFGNKRIIIINDLNLCKKTFNREPFCIHNAPKNPAKSSSIVQTNGKQYNNRRKIIHDAFMNVLNSDYLNKIGSKQFEHQIFDKIDLISNGNTTYFPLKHIEYGVFSILFIAIFGNYVAIPSIESDEYKSFITNLNKLSENFIRKGLLKQLINANLMKLIQACSGEKNKPNIGEIVYKIIAKWIQMFKNGSKMINDKACIVNIIGKYNNNIRLVISDLIALFLAGTNTTTGSLVKGIFMFAKYESMQYDIYNELMEYKSKYGVFELNKIYELNKLRAFVHELLRFRRSTFGIPRIIKENNVKLNGYNIPGNCIVIGSYSVFCHDEKYWKNPFEFDLNNWLDDSGNFKSNQAFATFGLGKRDCVGRALAMRELYLLLGRLLLRYKFIPTQNGMPDVFWYQHRYPDYKTVPIYVQLRE
eukprot:305691_1